MCVSYCPTRLKRHGFMRDLVCSVKYFVAPINSSLLTVRTTLVYSDTKYSAPCMSLLPSSIMSHYLFIRFAFTVFVSFVPLVINSFLHLFIHSVFHSFTHSFFHSFFLSFLGSVFLCLVTWCDFVEYTAHGLACT